MLGLILRSLDAAEAASMRLAPSRSPRVAASRRRRSWPAKQAARPRRKEEVAEEERPIEARATARAVAIWMQKTKRASSASIDAAARRELEAENRRRADVLLRKEAKAKKRGKSY